MAGPGFRKDLGFLGPAVSALVRPGFQMGTGMVQADPASLGRAVSMCLAIRKGTGQADLGLRKDPDARVGFSILGISGFLMAFLWMRLLQGGILCRSLLSGFDVFPFWES